MMSENIHHEDANDDRVLPVELRLEYAEAPLGVDTRNPRFGWEFSGLGRGREQTAYRILVASTRDRLAEDTGDLWDSGKITSDETSHAPYSGEELVSCERYYWKVRVWDEDDAPSAWSDTTYWEMGLLSEGDWEANWIGTPQLDTQRPGETWTDYALIAEFELGSKEMGVAFRAQDTENLYLWEIERASETAPLRLRPHVCEDGEWRLLDEVSAEEIADRAEPERFRVRLDIEGTTITTTINGQVVDRRTDDTHARGTIGFQSSETAAARVGSVRVVGREGEVLYSTDFSYPYVQEFSRTDVVGSRLKLQDDAVALRRHPLVSNPLFRREFSVADAVSEARVYVSGLGTYELYVNGKRIGDRVLDPARTDYEETVLYATYDVTDKITSGKNALGIALGRGWYGEPEPRVWAPPEGEGIVNRPDRNEIDWWSDPELRIQLELEFDDGTTATVVSDEAWKTADGPTLYSSLLTFKESYDARHEKTGWSAPRYDDSDWENASRVSGPSGEMASQQMQPICVADTVKAETVTEPEPGVYVYDLGEMIAGWVELRVRGERGTEVTITEGEQLSKDGTVTEIQYGGRRYHEQRYTLDGEGTETWEPRFSYGGFRYIQIEGYPEKPTVDDVTGKIVHSAVENGESQFDTSEELLERIHWGSRRAILNNLVGIHHGTPTWEKLGWMETKIELAESTIYNFSMARFLTKFLRDCRDAQKENGNMRYVVPSPEPYAMRMGDRNDPGWGGGYPVVVWLMYVYYGDQRVLRENYENMVDYARYMQRNAENGVLVRTGIGDYKPPGHRFSPEGPALVSTAHYLQVVQIVAETAEVLSRDEDATEFSRLGESIKEAFNEEFFDPDAEIYRTGETDEYRQTSNAYPLAFGLVPGGHEGAVAKNLAENILDEYDGHFDLGAHGLRYLLPALTDAGYHDVAYTVLSQITYPSFGYWFENGITVLLESWELDARSRVHDFLGSVEQWLYQYLAGIREPLEPGFERVEIAPQPVGDIEQAGATVKTIRGSITARWERMTTGDGTGQQFRLLVRLPHNTKGVVRIPIPNSEEIRLQEDDHRIWDAGDQTCQMPPGIRGVKRSKNTIVIEIGSGKFQFAIDH